jgi:hypothetical protein
VLLIAQELRVFFGFGSSPSFARSASFSAGALLGSRGFGVLIVDLGHDFADLGVGIRLDKVPEQIGQTEQVTESSNGIIFLLRRKEKKMVMH